MAAVCKAGEHPGGYLRMSEVAAAAAGGGYAASATTAPDAVSTEATGSRSAVLDFDVGLPPQLLLQVR